MRISDWSSDVCSSDLFAPGRKTCPLAGRKPGDIDFVVVRENTEGEYSSVGGITFPGTEREIVVQETIMTRHGTDRILRYAFDLAQRRPARHLTSATKSNGIAITMPWWDSRVEAMAATYPQVRTDKRSEEHTPELQSLMRNSSAA